LEDVLGRTVTLRVQRLGAPGAFLQVAARESVLLPRAELSEPPEPGDELEVFVYVDSEDRPVATTRKPRLERDEVAFLRVTSETRIGAFVDWGLPKELLVPFAEQTRELRRGDHEPIGLVLDRSGRLAGTMRIRELLQTGGRFELGEWVEGEAWREEPGVGVFVILERGYLGLLPASEPHALRRGQACSFRVAQVLADGKLELSLRGLVHEELAHDAEAVLARLLSERPPRVSDRSSPELIRDQFNLSKKAFKRAVGRLLKEGSVELDREGFVVPRRR
jgi:predicted RNA-binding protein (virulence factor B family)